MASSQHKSRRPLRLHGILPGDLIGFAACTPLAVAIRACTCGGINHVGIVTAWPPRDLTDHPRPSRQFPPVLCESTANPCGPCVSQGIEVRGVQVHFLRQRILSHAGRVYHYPLAERLTERQQDILQEFCESHLGTEYDYHGAADARHTLIAALVRAVRGEDLDEVFCSEWAAACYRELGLLDANPSRFSPSRLVRYQRRAGVLGKPRRVK